jgi:hypothetical protein
MHKIQWLGGLALAALCVPAPAMAELRYERGEFVLVANANVSLTGALVDDPELDLGFEEEGDVDAFGSLNVEWTSKSGVIVGAYASGDTADNRPDTLKNDRLYGYVASEWGRAEVGLTSGPARRMSFYAPVLGSGQIRGDFARYSGPPALLWPTDTRQSFKLAYFSPPLGGLRLGVSWAPEVDRGNAVHRNGFELGAQYERPVGEWVLGGSAAYVHGGAERPGLADIDSWSLGAQARRGKLTIGGAFVERGDSALFRDGFDQSEVNAGVAWREEKWGLALSASRTSARGFDYDLVGLGGSYNIGRHVVLTADVVAMRHDFEPAEPQSGVVLVGGVEFRI